MLQMRHGMISSRHAWQDLLFMGMDVLEEDSVELSV